MLQPCPDCGREVSPRAAFCPQCGAPIAATSARAAPTPVVVHRGGSSGGNVMAALLSLIVPGLGQFVQGRLGDATVVIAVVVGYALFAVVGMATAARENAPGVILLIVIGGLAVHLWQVRDAAIYDPNRGG